MHKSQELVLPLLTFTGDYRRLAENLMGLLLLSLSRLIFLKTKYQSDFSIYERGFECEEAVNLCRQNKGGKPSTLLPLSEYNLSIKILRYRRNLSKCMG